MTARGPLDRLLDSINRNESAVLRLISDGGARGAVTTDFAAWRRSITAAMKERDELTVALRLAQMWLRNLDGHNEHTQKQVAAWDVLLARSKGVRDV